MCPGNMQKMNHLSLSEYVYFLCNHLLPGFLIISMKKLLYFFWLCVIPIVGHAQEATAHHQAYRALNRELGEHAAALYHPQKNPRKAFEREVAREHINGMKHCMAQQRRHLKYLRSQGDPYGMTPRALRQMSTYHDANVRHRRKLSEELDRKQLRPSKIRAHSRKIHENTEKIDGILS